MYSSAREAESRLQDLVPDATSEEINSALSTACRNVDVAAQNLLGTALKYHFFILLIVYKFYNVC